MSDHDEEQQSVKILLVEDDRVQTLMIEAALERLPRLDLMHAAEDGVEAMEFLRHRSQCINGQLPDMILLDINMPKKNGFEVLAELKSDPRLRAIPVIMFSSSDAQEDIDGAYGEGANTFITKPVTLKDLEEVLNRIADYWVMSARLPTNLGATRQERPRIRISAG